MGPRGLFLLAAFANLRSGAERPSALERSPSGGLPPPPQGGGSVGARARSVEDKLSQTGSSFDESGVSSDSGEEFGPADGPDRSLQLLANFYEPAGGAVAEELDMLKESGKDLRLAANNWTRKGHEAIVGAHHVLQRSTNDAQTVLFSDALRFNQGLEDNMKNETLKMDAISFDPRAKLGIMRQHGFSDGILYPPIESMDQAEELRNKPVLCNSQYKGDKWQYVHNQKGKIISFDPATKKWQIRLTSGELKEELQELRREEFVILDTTETLDGQALDEDASGGMGGHTLKEFTRIRNTFFDKQVRIDAVPRHLAAKLGKLLHQIGTIVGYRYSGSQPEFQIKLFSDNSEGNDNAVWLVMDRDFHMVEKLKNHTVQVQQPTMGRVLDYHENASLKEGGYYSVQIPAHVVEVKPDQIERTPARWDEQHQSNDLIGAKVTIPSNHTGYEVEGTIKSYANGQHEGITTQYNVELEDGNEKQMKMTDFLYIHRGFQAHTGQVVEISPEDHLDSDPYLVIVGRQTGDALTTFRVSLQNGQESTRTGAQLSLGKLVNDERLENMRVEFVDPSHDANHLRGTIVAFKGHGRYTIQTDDGPELTLMMDEFTVIRFAGLEAGEANAGAGEFSNVFRKVYFLAEARESCREACQSQGLSCDQDMLTQAAGSDQKCKSIIESLGQTVEMGEIEDDNNAGCTFEQNVAGPEGHGIGTLFNQVLPRPDNRCSLARDAAGRRQRVCACKGKQKCMAAIHDDPSFCTRQPGMLDAHDLNAECQQPLCDRVSDKGTCCRPEVTCQSTINTDATFCTSRDLMNAANLNVVCAGDLCSRRMCCLETCLSAINANAGFCIDQNMVNAGDADMLRSVTCAGPQCNALDKDLCCRPPPPLPLVGGPAV